MLNGNQTIGGGGQNPQNLVMRDNLHYAADSVSNAMSSLVKELNTGANYFMVSSETFFSRISDVRNAAIFSFLLIA